MFRFLLRNSGFLCLGWTLLAGSCNTTEPPPPPPPEPQPTISVSFEDASCVELWLKVSVTDAISPHTVALVRDSMLLMSAEFTANDTVLVDEGLAPNRMYSYTALLLKDSTTLATSPVTTARTLDTTSHTFTWQIDTIGDNALLYDVAIINDTLAYAVGEIYKRDSLGNWDPRRYNLAIWNGTSWRIERLMYQGSPPVLRSVFAFAENDVWLDPWFHWNGQTFQQIPIDPIFIGVGVNKMWGSPDGRLYVVGNGGFIAERSPTGTWRRLESGTTLDVYDISGDRNPVTGETEVLAIASNVFTNQGKALLRIQGTVATLLSDTGLTWGVNAIWFSAGRRYYVVGPGIHQKRLLSDMVWAVYPPGLVTSYFSDGVQGSAVNDVFVVGSFREVVHFNGITWHRYGELMPGSSGSFGAIGLRGNLAIIVGRNTPNAMIAIGRR